LTLSSRSGLQIVLNVALFLNWIEVNLVKCFILQIKIWVSGFYPTRDLIFDSQLKFWHLWMVTDLRLFERKKNESLRANLFKLTEFVKMKTTCINMSRIIIILFFKFYIADKAYRWHLAISLCFPSKLVFLQALFLYGSEASSMCVCDIHITSCHFYSPPLSPFFGAKWQKSHFNPLVAFQHSHQCYFRLTNTV